MLDRRLLSDGRFRHSKLNTLGANFFEKRPLFVRQIISEIREWKPSVHRMQDNKILFASADDVDIKTKRGKIFGEKVVLQLNADRKPFKTEIVVTTNRNGTYCALIADDLRKK